MADNTLPSTLAVVRDGNVAILTLNRAAKRNALDDDTVIGLRRYFMDLPADIGAVVLNGDGKHFCAGLDLAEVTGTADIHKAFHEIQFGRVPVISVLHGAVVGGGLELAASTHIRIAERSAYYGLPEGQRGIFLGGGGSVRIPKLIGVAAVQDMMLTGRTLSAEDGYARGLSQYLVDDGAGMTLAMDLARRAAGNAPLTNLAVIHALPRIAEADPATGLFTESLMAAIAETAPEAQARLRDFLGKRAAKITHG
jgi:(methylthio)acryloyl-CoA hydratase